MFVNELCECGETFVDTDRQTLVGLFFLRLAEMDNITPVIQPSSPLQDATDAQVRAETPSPDPQSPQETAEQIQLKIEQENKERERQLEIIKNQARNLLLAAETHLRRETSPMLQTVRQESDFVGI